ncbi:class I SAM-dependent DNA methyltransferase [Azohydromonas lata]|uniref:site-specific DNA-methyltransferase (adenine-specific) n=1 Tax=Azohydromonas lata TaxID=45677 RepID=A0ABU5IK67_9BURK|nr:DNA methyltransferase [Azohydromonas lata]MDZ5459277.1 type IIL restriction-modification enzyme MmeI [Azohydromonas lata]
MKRTGAAQGWADVWKRGCFGWEYKSPGAKLDVALKQLMQYALPLENPPLLVVSDRLHIEIHTHFTGTPSTCHTISLEDLADPLARQSLRQVFINPEAFRPARTNRQITEEAARTFAETAARLRAAGVPAAQVSHFLTQCLFCFFAEDVGLLPARLFERLVGVSVAPDRLRAQLQALFSTMRDGGMFGVDDVPWFNGGLFLQVEVPPLAIKDVKALRTASALNWSAIDPSIFGTLFERGLDPLKRSQLGAHYTDPATIERLIEPVVRRPLLDEWNPCRDAIAAALARSKRVGDKAHREAQAAFSGYLERLREFRVLDPACGSGNFLYLSLKALKDVEHQAGLEAEALGLQRQIDVTGPHNMLGLEINEYAAELARVTVWIGELQWRIQHGYGFRMNPVLQSLDHIMCGDALMAPDGTETAWPIADVVVGNPPFVGDKRMRAELGDDYTQNLRALYAGRVPGGADLVCYWFEKARANIEAGTLQRAGLVATSSIRGGRNREVLHRIVNTSRIFEAWSDEPWVNNGAAVRVSLAAFGNSEQRAKLNGGAVTAIAADLTAAGKNGQDDLTQAAALNENFGASYLGIQKTGPFEIDGDLARKWLKLPNPDGCSNSDVLRPWWNGLDVVRRNRDMWINDFGVDMPLKKAKMYEAPFAYVLENVKPTRAGNREAGTTAQWWLFHRPRPAMREAVAGLSRFIVTPEVSKHRIFAWLPSAVMPDKNLIVIARADDATFGILQSRMHMVWALRMGTSLEDRPRYTPTTTFETYPFPAGLTPADTVHKRIKTLSSGTSIPAKLPTDVRMHAEAIALAAYRLERLRQNWLNPPAWIKKVAEVAPLGQKTSPYPVRIIPKSDFENELKKRTLTNLYNKPPAWLTEAHAALDAAVAAAYGWTEAVELLSDEEILRRLLALNQARTAGQHA